MGDVIEVDETPIILVGFGAIILWVILMFLGVI
jgi:hypothetical protein